MVARIAGSMIVCVAVLLAVSLLVSLGVLWWTGSVLTSTTIGTVCGLGAAFAVNALHAAVGREGERLRDKSYLPSSGGIADPGRPSREEDVDPKGLHK